MTIRDRTKKQIRAWANVTRIVYTGDQICDVWVAGNNAAPCKSNLSRLIGMLDKEFPDRKLDISTGWIEKKTVDDVIGRVEEAPPK
jgi:hypothetical protein